MWERYLRDSLFGDQEGACPMRVLAGIAVVVALAEPALGQERVAGKAEAPANVGGIVVIDGDTVERGGQRWRLMDLDTPEIHTSGCPGERELGRLAAARLIELLRQRGGRLVDAEKREKFGRKLGRLIIGWPVAGEEPWAAIAIREGLAVGWDGKGRRHDWCALTAPPAARKR